MGSEDKGTLLQARIKNDEKEIGFGFIIFGILLVIIIVNVSYLNYLLWQNSKNNNTQNQNIQTEYSNNISITPIPTTCVDCESQTSSPTGTYITKTPILQQSSNNSGVREYYIPLGTGSNTSTTWANVAGTETTINFNNYQNIKDIHFEASIDTASSNQTVSVQLYNVTDNHPVWNSQVTTNGSTSQYLVSQPISYDGGHKIYQVQMQNQLQTPVNLLQARLRIILE